MLVRNKEGKFFEIDEEQLKGKEVEGPKPPKGPSGPPPGGGGAAPLIVVNVGGRPGPGPGGDPDLREVLQARKTTTTRRVAGGGITGGIITIGNNYRIATSGALAHL